jgi:hypothetical protein
MKTISRTGLFAILFLALIFSSCQNETIQEIPNDPQENVSEGSDLLIYLRSSTDSETNNNVEDDCVDLSFRYDFKIQSDLDASLSLSIWNLLNRTNVLNRFYSFDISDQIMERNSEALGLTPNLSFRLRF